MRGTVAVTGAGGFLGGHLVRAALKQGHRVIAVTRRPEWTAPPEGLVPLDGDLSTPGVWKKLAALKPESLIHLAAVTPPSLFGAEAEAAAARNRDLDRRALEFCARTGARFVYAGGAIVYGLDYTGPRTEESPPDPPGPYARGKLDTESEMASAGLLEPVSLRLSAPYGPGQRAATVIRLFVERALSGEPLLYHGSGERTQDFTWGEDVALAFLAALKPGVRGIFNVAGGEPVSMRRLAALVAGLVPGCASGIGPSGREDPQERFRAAIDITRAKKLLVWEPATPLRLGLSRLIGCMEGRR